MADDYPRQYAKAVDPPPDDEEAAFHAAMHARPHDPLPSLVYADWLAEHGKEATAELIRHAAEHGGERGRSGDDTWIAYPSEKEYPRAIAFRGEYYGHNLILRLVSKALPGKVLSWHRQYLDPADVTAALHRLADEGALVGAGTRRDYMEKSHFGK